MATGWSGPRGQLDLLHDDADKVTREVIERRQATIEERFWTFHRAHPFVYTQLVRFARQAAERGYRRVGIAWIWERMRWEIRMSWAHPQEIKLNNDYRALYARLIMASEPDLRDFFVTRALPTSRWERPA